MATVTYEIPLVFTDSEGEVLKRRPLPWMLDYLEMDFNRSLEDGITMSSILHHDIPAANGIEAKASVKDRKLYANASFKNTPSAEVIEEVRQWILGQCSDGWGENGFEFDFYGGESVTVYPWIEGVEPKVVSRG